MNFIRNFYKNTNNDKKIIAGNYVSLFVLQIANYLLPLLILPFLVRVLGTEKFGLIMFAQSLVLFLTIFVDFGFNLSGTREISLAREEKQKLSEIFTAIIIIKVGLVLIASFILFGVVNFFTRFRIDAQIYYLSFGVVIGQSIFPVWFFQGIEKMKFITFINIAAKTIFTLLVFVFIRVQSDYTLVPIFNSLGFIVSGIFGFLFCFRYVDFKFPPLSLIRRLLLESYSLYISNFAASLYTASNVFILGIFAGNTIAGVYASMEKLILAIKNIFTPLYQALYPWLSNQADYIKIKTIKRIRPIIFIVSLLITIAILLFGKTLLLIIYNNSLISSYATIFKILSFISIFSALNMLYNSLYFPSVKKYKVRMNILISGGVFNISLSLVLVYYFGIYGTAITVVTTELLLFILGTYFFNKYSKTSKQNGC
jgi:polysaccharide transporter, PST family